MLKIEFTTDNAAFREKDGELDNYAVAYCLDNVITCIKNGITYGKIHDYNGNYVGDWSLD